MEQHDNAQDDATLVQRVLAGERDAFGILLHRYEQSVLRLCQRLVHSAVEAQDIAQDAALEAFLRLPDLRAPDRFGAWLHGIATNLARMTLRRRRVLSLDETVGEHGMVVLARAPFPTPEEAYAAREVHADILAALNELPMVNRAAVIGFFLEGYSYAQLADMLGVPLSTVRGRLFQGRLHLRRTLGPLVRERAKINRQASPGSTQESTMEQPELVEMVISTVQHLPFLRGDKRYGVKLRDPATALEFGIVLREAEAGAIQHARGETWLGPPPPLPASLTLRLLALATATVERVVIHRAIWQSWYTTVMLAQGDHRAEIDVQPSEGLALASASGAPIYVRRALLEELGANPDQGARDESADQQFMERLAVTVDQAEVLIPAPAPLSVEVQRQVDDRLARLCADTDAIHGLVTHNSGRLLAMFGPADKEVLARYSKALILEPPGSQDLTELRQYKGLLVDTIFTADAWILFWPWSHGLVQISGFTIHDPDSHLELLKAATQDLETILSEG